jgi:glycosidase
LNEAFGSEADLKDLISQAKAKDMGIMVDVVSTDILEKNETLEDTVADSYCLAVKTGRQPRRSDGFGQLYPERFVRSFQQHRTVPSLLLGRW